MLPANKSLIESALRRAGINAEIIKGRGYFYFVGEIGSYLDVGRFSTSVYGYCYYNQLSVGEWVELAKGVISRNKEI